MTRLTIWIIAIGLFLAAGMLNASFEERDAQIIAEAIRKAETEKANVFAAMAHCLDGGSIKDEETVINCKRVRR
jgi:hypothetical protein